MNTPPWDRELDAELKKIALEAQKYKPKSVQRRRLLNSLIRKIQNSGKLCRPHRGQFVQYYAEIYTEACHRLFIYIGQKIDTFKADGEVLKWANYLLKNRFFWEASKEITSYYEIAGAERQVRRLSTEELDTEFNQQMQQTHSSLPSQQILELVREDPDRTFSSTYVTRRPDANFQYIFLQKSQGYTWKDIAKSLDMPQSTLSSFFQKWLKQFEPIFQEYLTD